MTSIIHSLRDAAAKRAAYHRTVEEIERMPKEVAWDLNIFREDAHQIAFDAVYGQKKAA